MKFIFIKFVRFYQIFCSRYVKTQCKFFPTCSEYCILAIKKYGVVKGSIKTFFRILRCNPFSDGGVDFP